MPAYISHTVMARDVYNKIKNKEVNKDYMVTFSLGGDLSKYSKCRKDSHNILLNEFIYNMCDYMKDNNLTHDGECLGVLYGHICHFIMDTTIHPLIWKVTKVCEKNKKNHTFIEMYYDYYLLKKHHNLRTNKYKNSEMLKGKINKKVKDLLNETYKKTYKCDNLSRYYKFNLWLYRKIRILYVLFPFNFLKKVVGMSSFLKKNKDIDLLNENKNIEYKDLNELYDISVNKAIEYISEVNEYLYK